MNDNNSKNNKNNTPNIDIELSKNNNDLTFSSIQLSKAPTPVEEKRNIFKEEVNEEINKEEEKLYNTQVLLKVTPEPKKSLYNTIVLKLDNIIKKNNSLKKKSIKKITNVEHNSQNVIPIMKGKNITKKQDVKINVDSKAFFLQQRNLCIIALNNISSTIDDSQKKAIRKHSKKIDLSKINNIHINKTNYTNYKEQLTEYATKKMYNQFAPKETTKYKIYKYSVIVTSIVFAFSFISILGWLYQGMSSKALVKDMVNNLVVEKIESDYEDLYNIQMPEAEFSLTSIYWKYLETPLYSVDLNDLYKQNSDTIGWLFVNNTNINYPVVQTDNNSYYLSHSFTKSKNWAGWVFADYRNDFSELNKNTVIYAHGRKDKIMFGSLFNALKPEWYKDTDNQIIQLSTFNYNTMWQIFSIYTIDAETYYITTDFSSNYSYAKFLDEMKNRSIYDFNIPLDENDKVLTLSTCYNDKGVRLVLQAKLVKIQKR